MSIDYMVVRFQQGEGAELDQSVFDDIFGAYLVEEEDDFARADFPDGSAADIYHDDDSVMFNHCGGEAFREAVYQLIARTQGYIYWGSGDGAVADAATLAELPELPGRIGVVRSGQELLDWIDRSQRDSSCPPPGR